MKNTIPDLIGIGDVSLALCSSTRVDVRLPGFMSDHMVLQQQRKIR